MLKYSSDQDFKAFCSLYHIISFCESFVRDHSDFRDFLDGYHTFNSVREKLHRRGRYSGGITVFVRDVSIKQGIISRLYDSFENCVVLYVQSGRLSWDRDTVCIFPYLSPEDSPIYRNSETDGMSILEDYLFTIATDHPDKHFFLAGDLNARMKNFTDYILDDNIDHLYDTQDYPSDSFDLPRSSKDKMHNNYGVKLAELCRIYGIHAFNGRLFNDLNGEFTFITHNGTSVVDYM